MTYAPRLSGGPAPIDRDAVATRFLHRPMVFQEPDRVVAPPSWLDYTPFAFWIMDALRPATFVELGCHSGNSYASLAQAVQVLGLTTTCYGVDTWRGDPHAGLYDEQVFEDWSTYHDRRFSTFSRLVRATFDEAVQQFSSGSIDLLHIDGYHTFDAVSHDFDVWRPKLSDRGIVLCHDIDVRERDFGAWRLWERLRDEYPSFDFRHGHGLGVLGIGHDLPEALRWLFSLRSGPPDTAQMVRLFFSRLGAAVLGRFEAGQAQRRLAASQTEATRLQEAHTTANAQLAAQRAEIATRTAEAEQLASDRTTLSSELTHAERRLAVSTHRVATLSHALRTTHEVLAARTTEAERFAWQVRSREAQIDELERELETRDRALHAADTMARTLDGEVAALLERVQRDTTGLHEESTRRRGLDALVSWSQQQVIETLRNGNGHGGGHRADDGVWRAMSRDFAAVRVAIGDGPGALAQAMRIASMPAKLRAFLTIGRSGLFHETWYRSRNPEVAERRLHPLVHFLTIGAAARRDPHPLFSTEFYLGQVGDLVGPGENAVHHYLTHGWRTCCSPHPLFEPTYYLAQNPDVARLGLNPLTHYLGYGATERRNPHPLFDIRFYLHEHPEVLDSGLDPLTHFVVTGARDGRSPHPLFDSVYYLDTYPDVAAEGWNALEHFVRCGWREGRNPSPAFDVAHYLDRHPDVRASGENPFVHYVLYGRAQGREPAPNRRARPRIENLAGTTRIALTASACGSAQDDRRTILFVSHVGSWRPRAGNEFRVHRLLRWYRQRGYRVVPVIAPLPGEELTPEAIDGIAAACGNAVQVHRDGRIEYVLRDLPDVLATLNGTFTSSFADLLKETDGGSARSRELLNLERTFCHDALISTVLHVQRSLGPHILQVEYIWMTRLLPLVHGQVLKVVDTHDVLSSIERKVRMFGLREVSIEAHEEGDRLRRADLAIAIQDDEAAELARLAPSVPVVTAGVDFDIVDDRRVPAAAGRLLFVASHNVRNRKGLEDFLRLAWPRIHQRLPQAELRVVGSVAQGMEGHTVPGVKILGLVDDLAAEYLDAAVVINPVVAGTGLKIKMVEALCHLRPIVTWPTGVDGLDPALAAYCLIARDWYEFAEQVITALTRPSGGTFTAADRAAIAERIAPERVYASLDATFRTFFEQLEPLERQSSREVVSAGD
jgi:hypothetical protein